MALELYSGSHCLSCGAGPLALVYDFGHMPPVNSFVAEDSAGTESMFPMELMVCEKCKLLQLLSVPPPSVLFSKYDHFSGASAGNQQHLSRVSNGITERFGGESLRILEIGCNDATLIRMLAEHGHSTLGIDPAENVYDSKLSPDVEVLHDFFSEEVGASLIKGRAPFDLVIGLNVFAHNASFLSALKGVRTCLSDKGVLWLEVAYAPKTIADGNFDTIYHEHVCSFTLYALEKAIGLAGMQAFDAELIPTQGGSIRLFARRDDAGATPTEQLIDIRKKEKHQGVWERPFYEGISNKIYQKTNSIRDHFLRSVEQKQRIVLIGAPARGVVISNVCDFNTPYSIVALDDTQEKIGKLIPGTKIPVISWSDFDPEKFDSAIVLSWNYADYLVDRVRDAGFKGPITVPLPDVVTYTL